MSDPAKPPRRRWQFHLGTVVAATLCAGAMLGVNFHERELIEPYGGAAPYICDEKGVARVSGFGWPCVCTLRLEFDDSQTAMFQSCFKSENASVAADGGQQWNDASDGYSIVMKSKNGRYVEEFRNSMDTKIPMAINLVTAIAICGALVALLEFFLRRRAHPAAA